MERPKERLAIQNKIRATGRKHKEFGIDTCISSYFGKHYWCDWQETIDSMIKSGKLVTLPNNMYQLVG